MILTGLMLSMIALAQLPSNFNQISETEFGKRTVENYVQKLTDMGQLSLVFNEIEAGTISGYIEKLKAKGFEDLAIKINDINTAFNANKLCFVKGGKIYVLTYDEGISDDPQYAQRNHKGMYLYRRDADGWKKASDLVRTDTYLQGEFMKTFISKTVRWNDKSDYLQDNWGKGSVTNTTNGCVYIIFETLVWYPQTNYNNYNSIAVFVPNGDETYNVSYFEPNDEGKSGKSGKGIILYSQSFKNGKETLVGSSPASIPILSGYFDHSETDNGLTMTFDIGTLIFEITDNIAVLDSNSTIKLNRVR